MSELVIRVRASSLPTFADCPKRWAAEHIEGIRRPPSPRSTLGSAIHASTTVYDQHIIDGTPVRPDEAAGAAIDYLHEHADETDWTDPDDDLRLKGAEIIALSLHERYCTEIAPTRLYSACEVDLGELEVEVMDGVVVVLTGHADRIRLERLIDHDTQEPADTEVVSDIKSGKAAVNAHGVVEVKGHAAQVASYKLLRHRQTGIAMSRRTEIIGLATGKTAQTQRVGTALAEDVEETLIGTEDKPGLLHTLGVMAKYDAFHGNPKSTLCSPKFCPIYNACHFRK